MCEIQFIKRFGGNINQADRHRFFRMMEEGAIGNPHAFGLITPSYLCKVSGMFNELLINRKELLKNNFIIGHNRYATSGYKHDYQEDDSMGWWDIAEGAWPINAMTLTNPFILTYAAASLFRKKTKKKIEPKIKIKDDKPTLPEIRFNDNVNNHPFRIGNLIMVHNGVIWNHSLLRQEHIKDKKIKTRTDSYIILFLIDKYMKESRQKTRQDKLVEAIQKTMLEISGTYSIFLYDAKENQVYYFKDDCTSFNFYSIGDVLIGSTSDDNIRRMYNKETLKKATKIKIYPGIIHVITNDKNKPIKKLAFIDAEKQRRIVEKVSKLNSNKKTSESFIKSIIFPKWLRAKNKKR